VQRFFCFKVGEQFSLEGFLIKINVRVPVLKGFGQGRVLRVEPVLADDLLKLALEFLEQEEHVTHINKALFSLQLAEHVLLNLPRPLLESRPNCLFNILNILIGLKLCCNQFLDRKVNFPNAIFGVMDLLVDVVFHQSLPHENGSEGFGLKVLFNLDCNF
jgi:hypothetical protein